MKRGGGDPGAVAVLEAMKQDIAKRLRPVCVGMPEAEFARLVDDVARVNMKYRTRRTDDMFEAVAAPAPQEPA